MVGMGARPEVGVCGSGAPLSSAPFFHQGTKLGRCRLLQNDMGRNTRSIRFGSSGGISRTLGSCTPNDLLGKFLLSGAEVLILSKGTESCEEMAASAEFGNGVCLDKGK